jgi:Xaa-Pro aminopeptidase
MPAHDRSDYPKRLKKLNKALSKGHVDAMLIMTPVNRFYLTGFRSTMGLIVVEPGRDMQLLVDARYYEMARKEVPEAKVVRVSNLGKDLARMASRRKWKRVGFEGQITTRDLAMFQSALADTKEWCDTGTVLEELRQIKSRREQGILRRAARLGDEVFARTLASVEPGMSEWDIRRELRYWVDELDAEGESFDCIVSVGNNSSKPHAHVTDRVLRGNQPLLIDMGIVLDGYCSDMTRTVFFGRASKKMREIYKIVLDAQMKACGAARAGISCGELDAVARRHIAKAGYGEKFSHGLGHGVGIDIHEAPTLRKGVDTVLKPGMVVSIEPGIYLPGVGGVRIEDVVIIRRDGCENLTQTPKKQLEI